MTRWWIFPLLLAACGDDGGGSSDGGGSGSNTNPHFEITTSNGSPATAPVFTTTRPNVKSTLMLTVENTGSTPSGSLALALADTMHIQLDSATTCIDAILSSASQATCEIAVALETFHAGTHATDLTITTGLGDIVLPLSGEVTLPDVTVTPTTYNFGTVAVGTSHTFVVRNNDTLPFNGNINTNGPFQTSMDCTLPIAPGATCNLMVSVDGTGAFSGSIAIDLDATNKITVPITGTGT